jgi:hypothetical protein
MSKMPPSMWEEPEAFPSESDRIDAERTHEHHADHGDHEHGEGCGHDAIPHGDHVDYAHDGHRHWFHDGHWDEH